MSTPSPRIWVGIDPGWGGGIAVLGENDTPAYLEPMPETEQSIWHTIAAFLADKPATSVVVGIEKVGGFIGTRPGGGPHRNLASGHSMFKFGHAYGLVRMACVAADFPPEDVTPRAWQKAAGVECKVKGESQHKFKARIRDRARVLFPGVKITLDTADALLIARYLRGK
jgi:hypothetical protein